MVGIEQIEDEVLVFVVTPVTPVTPPIQQKGSVKKREHRFEYFFSQVTRKKGFIGRLVLEEGAYISQNCIHYFLDPQLKHPIILSFASLLQNLAWEFSVENLR